MHIEAPTTPAREPGTERRLPEPEQINWGELSTILQRAEAATAQLQTAHEAYITACQAETGRHPTAEQMQDSDTALAAEQKAYEEYAVAVKGRKEAMNKLDNYVHIVHKAYYEITEDERFLLERRQLLEVKLMSPDGTVALDIARAISEIDSRLPQIQADGDVAYNRLKKVLDEYTFALGSQPEAEAVAAK